ncbi:MAG TPA: hypothetical protein VHY35_13060 [Stellaceae bacterium]|jgi:hypothetical protein|nr:hypothetical protein [Stellaceae bacterium]
MNTPPVKLPEILEKIADLVFGASTKNKSKADKKEAWETGQTQITTRLLTFASF